MASQYTGLKAPPPLPMLELCVTDNYALEQLIYSCLVQ